MYNLPCPAPTAWSAMRCLGQSLNPDFTLSSLFVLSSYKLCKLSFYSPKLQSLLHTYSFSLYEITISTTCTRSTYLQYLYLPQLGKLSGRLQVSLYCKYSSTVSFLSNRSKERMGAAWWWDKTPHVQQRHRCSLCCSTAAQRLPLPSCGCDLLQMRDLTRLVWLVSLGSSL